MKLATTLLIFCVGALLSLGLVSLYSARLLQSGAHYLLMQLIWAGAGLVIGASAAAMDYRWLKKTSWALLAVAIVLLAVVLFTHKINGARRWFRLGMLNFQPSELAKLALIIALAHYGERYQRFMPTFGRGLALPGLFIGVVLGLIFIEPDRGTTILLTTVSGIMLVLAGARIWYLIPPILCGGAGLAWCLWSDPMRKQRILSWLNLEESKDGTGFQVWRSVMSIGNGGVEGVGLGNGHAIPERHTDFIFSVVGEEMGLIVSLATLVAFVMVIYCGLYIARHARDTFGFLLASGITFLIGLQAAINIGVVTGALPNKGLPLPFMSYGGSSLLLMLSAIGVLLSVARHARKVSDELSKDEREPDLEAAQLSA